MVTDDSQAHWGDQFAIHTDIKSLFYTPEANIMLYDNYAPIL